MAMQKKKFNRVLSSADSYQTDMTVQDYVHDDVFEANASDTLSIKSMSVVTLPCDTPREDISNMLLLPSVEYYTKSTVRAGTPADNNYETPLLHMKPPNHHQIDNTSSSLGNEETIADEGDMTVTSALLVPTSYINTAVSDGSSSNIEEMGISSPVHKYTAIACRAKDAEQKKRSTSVGTSVLDPLEELDEPCYV